MMRHDPKFVIVMNFWPGLICISYIVHYVLHQQYADDGRDAQSFLVWLVGFERAFGAFHLRNSFLLEEKRVWLN